MRSFFLEKILPYFSGEHHIVLNSRIYIIPGVIKF